MKWGQLMKYHLRLKGWRKGAEEKTEEVSIDGEDQHIPRISIWTFVETQ